MHEARQRSARGQSHGRFWRVSSRIGLPLAIVGIIGAAAVIGSLSLQHHHPREHRPSVSPAAPPPPGATGRWRLIFDDEFNGGSLNQRRWSSSRYNAGTIDKGFNSYDLECFDPSEVTVSHGHASLHLIAKRETCAGRDQPYAAGIITTFGKWSYRYGLLQARVWVPGSDHVVDWPAVWAVGDNFPAGGELDVMEGGSRGPCWFFHNANSGRGGCTSRKTTGAWHTFAADWEPGQITWFMDGFAVHRLTSGVTSSPMILILDLAASERFGGPVQAPARMLVDYVRVWQRP